MNVLLVWNGPDSDEERSVLARREIDFLHRLRELHVDASVALFGDRGGLAADLKAAGISTFVLPTALPPAAQSVTRLPFAAAGLRRLVRRLRPDVIEATEPMPAIAAGLATVGLRASRAVIYRRQHAGGRMRVRLAGRVAAGLNHRTIVSCEAMRALACTDDRSRAALVDIATTGSTVPADVDPGDVAAARRALGIDDAAHVVGSIAQLRHEKGIDVLIRCLEHIALDDVHLVIAGCGPEERNLRRIAAAQRVPVHFLGHRSDISLWLRAADVIAIPSRRQSVGRLTLEAMAVGKPVVASRVGGLPEALIDGQSGLLVAAEDEVALAGALREVLSDRALATRLGAGAHERWRSRYTMAHMAASRVAVWRRALAARERT
ncbi:MAG TPA: glycosyltransferase family 4 protein [Thermoanaerobaculia bacterium]|nr:glycosyltransferase family 4 protein [Thermoanaerobaculia bacterium]